MVTFNCNGNHSPATIGVTHYKTISLTTTIDGSNGGNTVAIGGSIANGVFSVTNGIALTLTNLVISGGIDRDGGCIHTNGALVLNNVQVRNCSTGSIGGRGGAIYVSNTGSAVLNNTNVLTGTAYVSGGAYSLGALTVTNSYFSHNTASTTDVGAIWGMGSTRIDSSTFYSNTATMGYGGGIYNQNVLSVSNSTLDSNYANLGGGGIQTYNGTTALQNVNIISNSVPSMTTGHEGGGLLASGATLTVTYSTLSGNRATSGGGISIQSNTIAKLTNVTLSGNTAYKNGGGIENLYILAITNTTVNSNTALSNGGGIHNSANAMLTNVTLSGNNALFNGGGMDNESPALLTNVTVNGNSAPFGGGIYQGSGNVILRNTIVANSSMSVNCGGTISSISNFGNNLDDGASCAFGSNSGSMSGTNPRLGPLANNGGATKTHALLPGSPAIDGVTYMPPNYCPSFDQRGWARPYPPLPFPMGKCDIGAYERGAFLFLPLILK